MDLIISETTSTKQQKQLVSVHVCIMCSYVHVSCVATCVMCSYVHVSCVAACVTCGYMCHV